MRGMAQGTGKAHARTAWQRHHCPIFVCRSLSLYIYMYISVATFYDMGGDVKHDFGPHAWDGSRHLDITARSDNGVLSHVASKLGSYAQAGSARRTLDSGGLWTPREHRTLDTALGQLTQRVLLDADGLVQTDPVLQWGQSANVGTLIVHHAVHDAHVAPGVFARSEVPRCSIRSQYQ